MSGAADVSHVEGSGNSRPWLVKNLQGAGPLRSKKTLVRCEWRLREATGVLLGTFWGLSGRIDSTTDLSSPTHHGFGRRGVRGMGHARETGHPARTSPNEFSHQGILA